MQETEIKLYNLLKNMINVAEKNNLDEVLKLKELFYIELKKTFGHLKDFYTNEKVLQYDRCYQYILQWIAIEDRREEFLKKSKTEFSKIKKPES